MRARTLIVLLALVGCVFAVVATSEGQKPAPNTEDARVLRGFQIAPVHLNLRGRDRTLVGLGSYIVNAQAGCNDCHTNPPYAPGGNPFEGEPKKINTAHYLAGGTPFPTDEGTVFSANITPDEHGLPAGLTFQEYKNLIRTGHDPDEPGEILQVMPWPIFKEMNDRDIKAVWEYLSSIPHAEP